MYKEQLLKNQNQNQNQDEDDNIEEVVKLIVEKEVCVNNMELVCTMMDFITPYIDKIIEDPSSLDNIQGVVMGIKDMFLSIQNDSLKRFDKCMNDLDVVLQKKGEL